MTTFNTPVGPLTPALIETLVNTIGSAETWDVPRADGRDYSVSGWKIGEGRKGLGSDDPETWRKGVTVTIYVTPSGKLITSTIASTRHGAVTGEVDDIRTDSMRSAVHETPASAFAWLEADGKGKLGPASKEAWRRACCSFPPLAGMDVEHID